MSKESKPAQKEPRWIKFFTEHLPLILFLIAYMKADLMTAIMVIVVSTTIALVLALIVARRVPALPLFVAGSVVLFGGLSVWLQDDTIYKMKPTIMYILFVIILMGGVAMNRYFMKSLMGDSLEMNDTGWLGLTIRYSGLFVVLAILNEVVWRTCSEETWVAFKIGGPLIGIFLFTLAQLPFIKQHSEEA
jgi:intracellular septation protein